ncbi:uncharacterized protein Z518_02003 [Rhinocladiella mackenziei CBS 650.93]|uniref:Uncharacterized protein n=1 Tax=Rhinocladiella mackenziei CBS 650.93 TaxID=1442369 RepID=A0A0D2JDQ8_9EURO|nr:uncharacterized protein Z518_02003 [Rhinocladiella mackenziei CBS 650.93]KIX07350.1 hypothetical protein Z518_02003 [Rhinocladiella mackenziei CBS 650.93]
MNQIPLSFACGLYDRLVPLATGQVKRAGISLIFLDIHHPREIFDRMTGNHGFDASELSSSEYITRYAAGDVEKPRIYGQPSSSPPMKTLNITKNGWQKSLSKMLQDDELDAIISPDKPSSMKEASYLRPLFPNFKVVEMEYFKKTGIFLSCT